MGTVKLDLFGAQPGRAGFPYKPSSGRVVEGRLGVDDRAYGGALDPSASLPAPARRVGRAAAKGVKRLGKGVMTILNIYGEKVGSRMVVQTYLFLRDYLKSLGRANVKDSTLAKRLLKPQREGGIPQGLVSGHGARIMQDNNHRIHSNIVSHHNLVKLDRKLPFLDFMAHVKPKVLAFFSENLLNKVQLI